MNSAPVRRVALVVPALPEGGGVAGMAEFLCRVIEQTPGWQARIIAPVMSASDALSVRLRAPASWLRTPRVAADQWAGRAILRVGCRLAELEFRRYQPHRVIDELLADCDLVQVVAGTPAWGLIATGAGRPVSLLYASHTALEQRRRRQTGRGARELWRSWMSRITERNDARALRRVDAVQTINPAMHEHARTVGAGRGIAPRHAPPGIDDGFFVPLPDRAAHLASDAPRSILCVGRLADPRKQVELLLEAYALLPAPLRARVSLLLAGYTGPPPHFWARADALGLRARIRFVEQPDAAALRALYQQALVFALPSDEEGLGIVLLEAMACAVPAVSTRSGGPEAIIRDGIDGLLCPLGDAAALAAQLARLCSDDALNLRLGAQARRSVEQRYSERVLGQAFIDTWRALLGDAVPAAQHAAEPANAAPSESAR